MGRNHRFPAIPRKDLLAEELVAVVPGEVLGTNDHVVRI